MIKRLMDKISASELLSILVFLPPGENSVVCFFRSVLQKIYRTGGKILAVFLL